MLQGVAPGAVGRVGVRRGPCVNAVCWSLITPPFQVVNESEHIAYVKQLADIGRLPKATGEFSREEAIALRDLRLQTVAEEPQNRTIASRAQQVSLEHDLLGPRS